MNFVFFDFMPNISLCIVEKYVCCFFFNIIEKYVHHTLCKRKLHRFIFLCNRAKDDPYVVLF